jgi:hypothetical protein
MTIVANPMVWQNMDTIVRDSTLMGIGVTTECRSDGDKDDTMVQDIDIIVIGTGQAGRVVGYYLRRTPYRWLILDAEPGAGGAWRHTWDTLHLFSPAQWSSLPGWPIQVVRQPNR